MKKKIISLLIMIGMMAWGCFLIYNMAKGDNLTKVKIVEINDNLLYTPQYIAINKNYFRNEGIYIDLIKVDNNNELIAALLLGDANLAITNLSLVKSIKKINLFDPPKVIYTMSNNDNPVVYASTESYSLNNKDIIEKINKALDKALYYINNNDDKTISKNIKLFFPHKTLSQIKEEVSGNKKKRFW